MTDIPPHLIALSHRLKEALRQVPQKRGRNPACKPLSKDQEDELRAELERLIEAELKRS